jgi:hypothetical protein
LATRMWANIAGPARPRRIGRGGAAVCTILTQSRQDFFGRWISTNFSLAAPNDSDLFGRR